MIEIVLVLMFLYFAFRVLEFIGSMLLQYLVLPALAIYAVWFVYDQSSSFMIDLATNWENALVKLGVTALIILSWYLSNWFDKNYK